MDAWWIGFTGNLAATLIGVLAAARLQPRGATPPLVDNRGGVIEGSVEQTNQTFIDRRVHVEFHSAPKETGQSAPAKEKSDDPPVVQGAIAFLAILALAAGYLLVREQTLAVFSFASTFLMAFLVSGILFSYRVSNVDSRLTWRLMVLPVVVASTIAARIWLGSSDYPSDRLAQVIDSELRITPMNALEFLTFNEVFFLASQGLALLLIAASLILISWGCIGLVIQIRRAQRGHTSSVVTRGLSTKTIFAASGFCAFALVLSSGVLSDRSWGQSLPGIETQAGLDVSVKKSPRKTGRSLVCVEAVDIDAREQRVVLQAKRKGTSTTAWHRIGTPMSFSENGTVCRDLRRRSGVGPYRFITKVDGEAKPLESDEFSLHTN